LLADSTERNEVCGYVLCIMLTKLWKPLGQWNLKHLGKCYYVSSFSQMKDLRFKNCLDWGVLGFYNWLHYAISIVGRFTPSIRKTPHSMFGEIFWIIDGNHIFIDQATKDCLAGHFSMTVSIVLHNQVNIKTINFAKNSDRALCLDGFDEAMFFQKNRK